jgi:uncharacterized protein (DUF2225 family)
MQLNNDQQIQAILTKILNRMPKCKHLYNFDHDALYMSKLSIEELYILERFLNAGEWWGRQDKIKEQMMDLLGHLLFLVSKDVKSRKNNIIAAEKQEAQRKERAKKEKERLAKIKAKQKKSAKDADELLKSLNLTREQKAALRKLADL